MMNAEMCIDLHNHILPGIDDGPKQLDESLEMAKIALSEGIAVVVCTPHIFPGVYHNDTHIIERAVNRLQRKLNEANLPLKLMVGADAHVSPDLLEQLQSRVVPTVNGSRYFLLEPPHVGFPSYLKAEVERYLAAGYVPLLTHPERLDWARQHYALFKELVDMGCWIQITAASITGYFGAGVKQLTERLLLDGLVHVVATDAHSSRFRKPELKAAFARAVQLVGHDEADALFNLRPLAVIENHAPNQVQAVPYLYDHFFKRQFWLMGSRLKYRLRLLS
jgi:protein-tyrosine phosphatase